MITRMTHEALQAPSAIAKQLIENEANWQALYTRLRGLEIPLVMTVARGSSDHAATFAKYLFEIKLGLVTASAAPSVVTLYQSRQKLKNCLVIALSQSGESPDICEVITFAQQQGAITVALVNQKQSQLANIAEYVLPLWAGEEQAVAATKSYLCMLTALLHGVGKISQDQHLLENLKQLPDLLRAGCQMDWSPAINVLKSQRDLLIVGRGYGFPIALEAALKCKEVAGLHAEAFSSAEVQHGPLALIQPNFPVLFFCQNDVTFSGNMTLMARLHDLGSQILLALPNNLQGEDLKQFTQVLPLPPSLDSLLDPLVAIQVFYLMIAELAIQRGHNPDQPANLQKITKTR